MVVAYDPRRVGRVFAGLYGYSSQRKELMESGRGLGFRNFALAGWPKQRERINMTVAQLIEKLSEFAPEAVIKVKYDERSYGELYRVSTSLFSAYIYLDAD